MGKLSEGNSAILPNEHTARLLEREIENMCIKYKINANLLYKQSENEDKILMGQQINKHE
jgi:hypothetical protein